MSRANVVRIAERYLGSGPACCRSAAPGYDLGKVSWCQIFWIHCLREAGLTDIVWGDLVPPKGKWVDGWMPRTDDPQPGDLAYINEPNQHGAIVERVDGDTVHTIDGNSLGRIVRRHSRDRDAFSAFYSIGSLLQSKNTDEGHRPLPFGGLQGEP